MSEERFTLSRRRRRMYLRKFDWVEARARHKAGETMTSIARSLGVDRRSVSRILKLPKRYIEQASSEQISEFRRVPRDRVTCPRCFGPMMPESKLCIHCHSATRLPRATTRAIPGTRTGQRVKLSSVDYHRIVEVDGDYGVVVPAPNKLPRGLRVVDFWFDGPCLISGEIRVAVMPSSEVIIDGRAQHGEEIR